jgi:HK97 gp10 family phage protein
MSNKAKVEFYGSADLIKKLEKAGKNLEKEIINALQKSIQKPKDEMIDFMQTKPEHKTGKTVSSWVEEIKEENGMIFMEAGFSVRKGGIASIFWNLGTPYRTPTFFIDKAVEENIDEIKRIQEETLKQAFRELM